MSAREIIHELDGLTPAELDEVQRRIAELTRTVPTLRLELHEGRLVLVGDRVVRQSEVEAILADFP